jgi:hypothetical protein
MEPTAISYDMLKTEEGQINAVFACFGSAAQHAQHFEVALGEFLLLFNKLANRELTLEAFEALDQKLQKQTMGTLLREFRKYVRINDAKVDRCLELALEKRNFLMHHYFRERESKLGVEKERMTLLAELVQIGSLLEQATALVGGMRVAFSNAMSKTEVREDADEKPLFSIEVALPDEKA